MPKEFASRIDQMSDPVKPHRWLFLRLAAPMLLISALSMATGVIGAVYVQRTQKAESRALADHVSSIVAAEQLVIAIRELRVALGRYAITHEEPRLLNLEPLIDDRDRWLAEVDRLSETERERELLKEIISGIKNFDAGLMEVRKGHPEDPDQNEVRRLVRITLSNEVLAPAQHYLDYNESQVAVSSARNELLADRLSYGLFLVGAFGAVGGVVAGYGMARAIRRSMIQLSLPIRDVAGKLGQVAGTMTIAADPEFENLENVLQEISRRVSSVVEQLHQSQQEALRAEQLASVGQLAAGLAHELRNPLTSMKILIQSALGPGEPTVVDREDLAIMDQEVTRLEDLVETFLNFARPPQLEKHPAVLQRLVEQTLTLVARRARVRGISVRHDFPADEMIVNADLGQMRQVLLNLMLNAIEAVPNGGDIEIRLDRYHSAPQRSSVGPGRMGWVQLSFLDNGKGLPTSLGERIFEPFVTTSQAGLGLGLSICKRIVEAHSGEIAAANRPVGGAVISIVLPLDVVRKQELIAHAEASGR